MTTGPLASRHAALGARTGLLGGASVVLGYPAGTVAEMQAVRERVGVIDLAHLGAVEVSGPDRNAFVNRVACNDVAALRPGQLHFSALLNARGGFLDEITVLRMDERLLLVTNAENAARTWQHLVAQKRGANIRLRDIGADTGTLGLEGPGVEALLQPLCSVPLAPLPFRHFRRALVAGIGVFCARQGYSGEDAFELHCRAADLPDLWDAVTTAGATPFGLEVRDALRLEMGYTAWGHELADDVQPAEVGLGWIAPLAKGTAFVGLPALRAAAERAPVRRLAALRPEDAAAPLEAGMTLVARGRPVGAVTSAGTSPLAGGTIALGFVTAGLEVPGTPLTAVGEAGEVPVQTCPKPFIGPRSRRR